MFAGTNYIPARGRAPQGARGLKFPGAHGVRYRLASRPARGARIEMIPPISAAGDSMEVAPRKGRED